MAGTGTMAGASALTKKVQRLWIAPAASRAESLAITPAMDVKVPTIQVAKVGRSGRHKAGDSSAASKILSAMDQEVDHSHFMARKQGGPSMSREAQPSGRGYMFSPTMLQPNPRDFGDAGPRAQRAASSAAGRLGAGSAARRMQSPTKGSRSRSAGAASSSPAPWRAAGESLPLAVTVVIHGTPHRSRYDVFQTTTLGQLQVKIEQRYKLDRDLQRLYKDEVELQGVSRRLDRLGVTNHSIIIVQPVALVIRVKIPRQKEATLHDVVSIMTVRQLKCRIEMACGIVVAQQRLRFLEVSDLEDDTLLTDHDIISGSTLSLHLWDNWKDVYSSIIMEDNSKAIWHLLRQDWQGVSRPRGQMTLTDFDKRKPSETGWAALYLTAHLGNVNLCRAFIRLQENAGDLAPHGQCHPVWPGPGLSPYGGHDECPPPSAFRQEPGTGRTPIHAAAYKGNTECVSVMLDAGSGFLVKDTDGMTAEFLAKRRNNFECAELLSMANWAHTMESYRRSLQEAKESGHTNVPYGPFHTFEISFGRTVPPGSGIMQPLDSLGAPARRGNAVLPSMVS